MRLDEFIAQLEAAGWRSQLDAQHQRITELWRAEYPGAASYLDALEETRAELAALRAELESAHAAQRHAETELSQYMAWYAMAEHQHLHEQRRAERAEQEAAKLRADAGRWRTVSAMMTHEHRGDAVGWTLSVILPGDDPDAAIDATLTQEDHND